MSALKKTDPNKTAELEIPEELLKSVKALKKEQGAIGEALAHAKRSVSTEASRKQDESTRVFNLRKVEMIEKIKALETKKAQVEREINSILQQKNSRVHQDLREATAFLVEETRKIAPIEKGIESKINSITNIKTELQMLFETATYERQKNLEVLKEQGKEIEHMSKMLNEATSLFKTDYKSLSGSVGELFEEKQALKLALARLKEEIFTSEANLKKLRAKEEELKDVGEDLRKGREKLEELRVSQLELSNFDVKLQDAKETYRNLEVTLNRKELEKMLLKQEVSRLEGVLGQLEDKILLQTLELSEAESSILSSKKRIEQIKQEEIDCFKHLAREQERLGIIREDLAKTESERISNSKSNDETSRFYEEKKNFYLRELELLKSSHESKIIALEAEYAKKKNDWEFEFKTYCSAKEEELKAHLAKTEQIGIENFKRRKNNFLNEVVNILSFQLNRKDFVTTEEKSKECKIELEKTFTHSFGKRSKWKFW